MRRRIGLAIAAALLLGGGCKEDIDFDFDGDGVPDDQDCAPEDPDRFPGNQDEAGDLYDADCDDCPEGSPAEAGDGYDEDCDGWPTNPVEGEPADCNDKDPDINPGAEEVENDGVDQNCDGSDCVDLDGDLACAADDCDDSDAALNHQDLDGDSASTCDGDCDDDDAALNLDDADEDGFTSCDGDCDDGDDAVIPEDLDGDGWTGCGGDCNDANPAIHPYAEEVCDGADNDCDPATDEDSDGDGDGFSLCDGDCDDTDTGLDAADLDLDGYSTCTGDCDDSSLFASPAAFERCSDSMDNDCDGDVDEDCLDCHIFVPGDYTTIDEAIAVASGGEEICVDPGTYVENLAFHGKAITVVGIAGEHLTTIDGSGMWDAVVQFSELEGPDSVLQGFTLTGGSGNHSGGGIYVAGASPTLRRLRIVQCSADMYVPATNIGGGGMYLRGSAATLSDIVVEGNTSFIKNEQVGYGGGIHIEDSEITAERITLADGYANHGGGLYVTSSSSVTIDGLVCRGNGAWRHGGCAYVYDSSTLQLDHALIVGNEAGELGGGLFADQDATLLLSNVAVLGNSVTGMSSDGGGICTQMATLTLTHGVVAGNEAIERGGGIFAGHTATLTNVVLWDNYAGNAEGEGGQGGGLYDFTGAADVNYCDAWANEPDDYYGVVVEPSAGNLAVDPGFLDATDADPDLWDLHLDPASGLVDAGDITLSDPDGGTSDIGLYGGLDADGWDLDGDGYPEWYQVGPYDPTTYPALGLDCDDRDTTVFPGQGC